MPFIVLVEEEISKFQSEKLSDYSTLHYKETMKRVE
jgi:hypothetical protein